jgi:glycosyltransferase involved in cell wall biosynthesis
MPTTRVVYYGIDTETADAAQPIELIRDKTGTRKVAVSCSRLVPYKGYEWALSALSLVPTDKRPGYIIIGDGEDLMRIGLLGQLTGAAPYFAGPVSDEEKFGIIKSADFGLYLAHNPNIPSQFPLESMYCGKPCIVHDVPINRERFGDHALYTNAFDTQETATVIREANQDRWDLLKPERRAASAEWIRQNRSFQSHANGILQVLREVAG